MKLKDEKIINLKIKSGSSKEYTIVKAIDKSGGGGNVFLCVDSDENQFAVKIFTRYMDIPGKKRKKAIKRFINERNIHLISDHPNVVRAFEIGLCKYDNKELPFYVMPIAKYNLEVYFKINNIKEDPLEVKRILNEIFDGLIYLHDKGIVHRDLKTKNFLVFEDNTVMIADCGMAHFPDELKKESIQTPSDEFINNEYYTDEKRSSPDRRIDICALARIIFKLLTGHLPIGINQSISSENDNFGSRFDEIIGKMENRNIEERYQDIRRVKEDINDYFDNIIPRFGSILDDKTYRILLNLDIELAEQFEFGILAFKNQKHKGRFAQSSNSFSFICKSLMLLKNKWSIDVKSLPKQSKDLKESLISELEQICIFFCRYS
ncbi:MAG: protein kinase [Promethearchaeota archaeon]